MRQTAIENFQNVSAWFLNHSVNEHLIGLIVLSRECYRKKYNFSNDKVNTAEAPAFNSSSFSLFRKAAWCCIA
jgi:cAMP phosphodiesterase